MNPKSHWVENFYLKCLYLGFILFLHFSISTVIIMNIMWSKQPPYTWSCLWNLKFWCFFFWKVLAFFKRVSEYLDQILQWKEMKEAFLVKLQTENLCFCLRWKLNKTQASQIKNINVVFNHIHQNIRTYPRSKKICIDQWLWKYNCMLRTEVGCGTTSGKFYNFYSPLSLESLDCCVNMNISFSWKLVP